MKGLPFSVLSFAGFCFACLDLSLEELGLGGGGG